MNKATQTQFYEGIPPSRIIDRSSQFTDNHLAVTGMCAGAAVIFPEITESECT